MKRTHMAKRYSANREPSQADIAFDALHDMLINLEIPPGSPVVEAEVMARIGVGRTPIREALTRLEAEELVNIYPRRGTFAADINIADLALITDLREELEGHAAQRAAERATSIDRETLDRLRVPHDRNASSVEQMAVDSDVHHAIYRAAHNRFLEATATRYHNLSMRIWKLFTDRLEELADHIDEHQVLLGHILDRRPAEARKTAAAHVRHFEAAVRELL